MVKKIDLKQLRNSEFSQFLVDVLTLISRNDPAALEVLEEYDLLKATSSEIDRLLKKKRSLEKTQQLVALDIRRDRCITGIVTCIQGNSYHFDENIQRHAEILLDHLELYGGGSIVRENYVSETATVKSLLKDWATKADLIIAIEGLNLGAWRDELEAANTAFHELYIDRTEEMGEADSTKLYDKRIEAIQQYYRLRDLIAAYHTVKEGAEPYGKVVMQLNALIDQYDALLVTRQGKSNTNGEGPLPEPEDTSE